MSERELRAYLLGQMSEEEAARFEGRLLDEDELFQTAESIEDDLLDDYARGRLEPSDRERFEVRYGTDGERHKFARALSARVDRAPSVPTLRRRATWQRFVPLAAAAAVVAVVGGVMLMRSGGPAADHTAVAKAPQPSQTAQEPSAVFALTLGTSRAAANPVQLTIPAGVSEIQFRIRLNPADRFDSYQIDLRSASTDSIAWHATDLHSALDAGDLVLPARARAADLADGAYEMAIRGVRAGASAPEDLGFLPVKVVRVR